MKILIKEAIDKAIEHKKLSYSSVMSLLNWSYEVFPKDMYYARKMTFSKIKYKLC